jgi:ribosomal protein S13
MATTKQKRVAKLKIENLLRVQPLTDIQILKSSNYSDSTAETKSTKIMNSQGVQEELEAQGFTEENAMKVVTEIMLNEKVDANARLKATDQVFKVQGTYAPEKKVSLNFNMNDEHKERATRAIRQLARRGDS